MAKKKQAKSAKRKTISARKTGTRARASRPKGLPKSELGQYKALLVKEREKIGGGLSHIAENTLKKSQRDASGDLSGYSYHMADMASDDYERDFSLGRATDEQKILYAIDEALKRVDDRTYGLCLTCGKMIPKKRLKALPHTELCIECQKMSEVK